MNARKFRRATGNLNATLLSPWLAAFAVPTIVFLGVVVAGDHDRHYLYGDGQYYFYTAVSLLEDRDLDLGNQLPPPLDRHSGDVALDLEGHLVPKHSIAMAIAAMPLIGALGPTGALLFNVMQLSVLAWLMARVAGRYSRPWAAAAAAVLTAVLSIFPMYAWNFSSDVFACVVLMAAVAALPPDHGADQCRHLVSGVLFGLSVVSKFSFVLAVVGAPLVSGRPLRRSLPAFAIGLGAPIIFLLAFNTALFGGPLTTSYDRMATIEKAGFSLSTQRSDFEPMRWMAIGVRGQLFDQRHGLLFTSPITLASLVGLVYLARRYPRVALYVAFTALGFFLFFSSYNWWRASHYGNRFLMPIMALAVIPLAALIDAAARRLRLRPWRIEPHSSGPPPVGEKGDQEP